MGSSKNLKAKKSVETLKSYGLPDFAQFQLFGGIRLMFHARIRKKVANSIELVKGYRMIPHMTP